MSKICVIGVYFGELPNYFPLWVKSAKSNKDIDFFIFGNNRLQDEANIKFHYIEWTDLKCRAEKVLGFSPALEKPYKCCDYKPLYGLLFADYVDGYEYWGHCDFDLIFGDFEKFLCESELGNYDRFLALGHLSLYRNTKEVNERYKVKNKYMSSEQVFRSNEIFVFDEIPGMTQTYIENSWPLYTKRIFVDIASIYKRYRIIESYKFDAKPKNYKNQIFYWEKGKIYRAYIEKGKLQKEEYLYMHFKKRPNFEIAPDLLTADSFYITKDGFFVKDQEVSLSDIDKYNPYKGIVYEWWEKTRFSVGGFLKKVKNRLKR